MGSNMAEAHPVGFQWVMEAKLRGARVIHVDPRYTRTSALADTYVQLRAGSDVVFLGGIVNHILSNELFFRDYVLPYTNAATIVSEDFQDTEDLDGLFSGYNPDKAVYDPTSWHYEGMEPHKGSHEASEEAREVAAGLQHESGGPALAHGTPPRDETLQHPRCVYQILKRHFARYTPEVVEEICGIPREQFLDVAETWAAASGRDRTGRGRVRGGLDPAHRRRAVHPDRGDHPAAARQHGPARRRDHGDARARQHPGLHRRADAVQPAARLPGDADRRPSAAAWTRGSPRCAGRTRRASGATPTRTRSRC
jgi:hypothetical protein